MNGVTECIARCNELRDFWSVRNQQFKKWYDLLLLTNNLEQEDMESVITNDPRTGYNLALHLLVSATMSHKIDIEGLEKPEIVGTSYLESYIERRWNKIEKEEARKGRQSWLRRVLGYMLATGWYSIFVYANNDELQAEIWHPANVFPEYGESGLEACAHIYPLKPMAAVRKAKKYGITFPVTPKSDVIVYNLFQIDEDGDVVNSLVIGDKLARPKSKIPKDDQVANIIPVFVSPVSGLPDNGVITTGKSWQKHFGESIVAVNEDEFNNNNKMQSFIQQLVRDSANPRWFEKSRSSKGILQPERMFKRGAIFRGTPEEDVMPLPTVPIPVETRTILMDYANRIQRGLFPWILHGNIQQQMSGYLASQISSAALSVLAPYSLGLVTLLSSIDNFWYNEIKSRRLRPYGFKMPKDLPDDIEFEVKHNIEIPGSLVQRATVARMLNPTYRLSFPRVTDMLFPEVKDPTREQALNNVDDAMSNEVAQIIAQVLAYREQAKISKEAGDISTSNLFSKAADALQAQIGSQPQRQIQPGQGQPMQPVEGREAAPMEEYQIPEGYGGK